MNNPSHRVLRLVLAATLMAGVATVLSGVGRSQVYQPQPSRPAPELPATLTLTPRNNIHPSAGLFGVRCQFDTVKNDMIFQGDQAVCGVRIPRLPRDTKFQVEFLIRAVTEAKFETAATNGNDVPTVRSFFTGPKGANRIFVHGKATKEKGGFVSVRCFVKDANWQLLSATVTPE